MNGWMDEGLDMYETLFIMKSYLKSHHVAFLILAVHSAHSIYLVSLPVQHFYTGNISWNHIFQIRKILHSCFILRITPPPSPRLFPSLPLTVFQEMTTNKQGKGALMEFFWIYKILEGGGTFWFENRNVFWVLFSPVCECRHIQSE